MQSSENADQAEASSFRRRHSLDSSAIRAAARSDTDGAMNTPPTQLTEPVSVSLPLPAVSYEPQPTSPRPRRRPYSLRSPATLSAETQFPLPRAPVPRQGLPALYATSDSPAPRLPGVLCTCHNCRRQRREATYTSEDSGYGWGPAAQCGSYAIPTNCPVSPALDTVCLKELCTFAQLTTGISRFRFYKLHVRRSVYLLSAASSALLQTLSAPGGGGYSSTDSGSDVHSNDPATARFRENPPYETTETPGWAFLQCTGDDWRPLDMRERINLRKWIRNARQFLQRHSGAADPMPPAEIAALFAEIAITNPIPPSLHWCRAPRWARLAMPLAERERFTPQNEEAWTKKMRQYIAWVEEATGIPTAVLTQLNAQCYDLAHMLAIFYAYEKAESLRERSSAVSGASDEDVNRIVSAPRRMTSSKMIFGSRRSRHKIRGANRSTWLPLTHSQRISLRVEMGQTYRHVQNFAVYDPCQEYPDELAGILGEVYISWPVPLDTNKDRPPRWSNRAVPEVDWQAAGMRGRRNFKARSRKYLKFVTDNSGVPTSQARRMDADAFDRLHASAVFKSIDTCTALYQTPVLNLAAPPDPVYTPGVGSGIWSPIASGSDNRQENGSETYNPSGSMRSGTLIGEEEARRRGYEFPTLPDTIMSSQAFSDPHQLQMSIRNRISHEAKEVEHYMSCTVKAVQSINRSLKDAGVLKSSRNSNVASGSEDPDHIFQDAEDDRATVTELPEGYTEEASTEAQGAEPLRTEEPGRKSTFVVESRTQRGGAADEEMRKWLQRELSLDPQYSWDCAACSGTGSNPKRKTAPRWRHEVLGPAYDAMTLEERKEWKELGRQYLMEVSYLTDVPVPALRNVEAALFEKFHIQALRNFIKRQKDYPQSFSPPNPTRAALEQPMPFTRKFLASQLSVSLQRIQNATEDDLAGLLSVLIFGGDAPFTFDRSKYPPWDIRLVPEERLVAMSDAQRRARQLHFRGETLAICKKFSLPFDVVRELDAATYAFAASAAAGRTNGNNQTHMHSAPQAPPVIYMQQGSGTIPVHMSPNVLQQPMPHIVTAPPPQAQGGQFHPSPGEQLPVQYVPVQSSPTVRFVPSPAPASSPACLPPLDSLCDIGPQATHGTSNTGPPTSGPSTGGLPPPYPQVVRIPVAKGTTQRSDAESSSPETGPVPFWFRQDESAPVEGNASRSKKKVTLPPLGETEAQASTEVFPGAAAETGDENVGEGTSLATEHLTQDSSEEDEWPVGAGAVPPPTLHDEEDSSEDSSEDDNKDGREDGVQFQSPDILPLGNEGDTEGSSSLGDEGNVEDRDTTNFQSPVMTQVESKGTVGAEEDEGAEGDTTAVPLIASENECAPDEDAADDEENDDIEFQNPIIAPMIEVRRAGTASEAMYRQSLIDHALRLIREAKPERDGCASVKELNKMTARDFRAMSTLDLASLVNRAIRSILEKAGVQETADLPSLDELVLENNGVSSMYTVSENKAPCFTVETGQDICHEDELVVEPSDQEDKEVLNSEMFQDVTLEGKLPESANNEHEDCITCSAEQQKLEPDNMATECEDVRHGEGITVCNQVGKLTPDDMSPASPAGEEDERASVGTQGGSNVRIYEGMVPRVISPASAETEEYLVAGAANGGASVMVRKIALDDDEEERRSHFFDRDWEREMH